MIMSSEISRPYDILNPNYISILSELLMKMWCKYIVGHPSINGMGYHLSKQSSLSYNTNNLLW